jgi:hypothetical protein
MKSRKQTQKQRTLVPQAESGQTVILMAFLMIALLGMLGLAIDGGRLFFAHRDAQNAVDSAIIAASYALCTGGDPEAAAHQAIRDNGFIHNGDDVRVVVAYPPIRDFSDLEAAGITIDLQYYIDVYLTVSIEPYFIQFVYDGALEMTTDGVGYCEPAWDPRALPAIWAGSPVCNNTVNWTGSSSSFTSLGDKLFFSNNELKVNGNASSPSTLEGDIESCGAAPELSGATLNPGSEEVFPCEGLQPEPPLPYEIGDYAAGGDISDEIIANPDLGLAYFITPATVAANPGVEPYKWYKNGTWTPDGSIEGLYYVEGDITIGNKADLLDTAADANSEWDGVTAVATGSISARQQDGFKYYGYLLDEPAYAGTGSRGTIPAMALFSDEAMTNCGSTTIDAGGSTTSFYGVIYAPKGGITFSGSSIIVHGALIGQVVNLSSSDMEFIYDPDMLPPRPSSIGVAS